MSDPKFARSTKQRERLLNEIQRQSQFLSAQDLHAQMKNTGENIGLSTVYRTLAALADQGVVDVLMREDGETLYRACSAEHHHHVVCRICGMTKEIQASEVEAWADKLAANLGFTQVNHTLEIVGLCKNCASS